MDASPGFFRRVSGLFILMPGFFLLEGLAAQDYRWSVMVDLAYLELFHGVGRGGHRHDDTPVIAGVMGVNVLQLLHKFRQHGGHPSTPLVSSLRRRLWTESISPARRTLGRLGTKSSEIRVKKRTIIPLSLSDGEGVDNLPVQVNRRLRQDLNIDNLGVFDILLH